MLTQELEKGNKGTIHGDSLFISAFTTKCFGGSLLSILRIFSMVGMYYICNTPGFNSKSSYFCLTIFNTARKLKKLAVNNFTLWAAMHSLRFIKPYTVNTSEP